MHSSPASCRFLYRGIFFNILSNTLDLCEILLWNILYRIYVFLPWRNIKNGHYLSMLCAEGYISFQVKILQRKEANMLVNITQVLGFFGLLRTL
jgi:hypothetical protein